MSMKKSLILLICVIAAVTIFSVMQTGGDSMQIDMSDTHISFSGIDDFKHEVAYSDITSVTLEAVSDWDVWGGHEFGYFRIGHMANYVLFVTTQCDHVIIAELSDGSRMVFNYNNRYGTEDIYYLLRENMVKYH